MRTIRLYFSVAVLIFLTVAIAHISPNTGEVQMSHVEAVETAAQTETPNVPAEPQKTISDHSIQASVVVEPPAQPVPEPTKPVEPVCGPADPQHIYDVLRSIGVPHVSAIQQLGSWKHESSFDPCQKIGDGGIAWGLNSWHPGRRRDMPQQLDEQIKWAVQVEMPRDCRACYDAFMAGESKWSVRAAIKKSTRWGVEGRRWYYADTFQNQIRQ